jgi:homoserine/homoserine lactone efflux protein
MGLATYLAFIVISIGVLLFPGPSILLIIANSLQRGRVIGLYTVAGGIAAMLVQLLVALVGLMSVERTFGAGFSYVRWAGVIYLLYLGVQRWRGQAHGELRGRLAGSYRSAVTEGFVVALTNPGTMLFFVAFFPQFLSANVLLAPQLMLMAGTFMLLTLSVDCSYALLSARLGRQLHQPEQVARRNHLAGAILLAAAVALALVNI